MLVILALLVLSVATTGCNVSEEMQNQIDKNGHHYVEVTIKTPGNTKVVAWKYTSQLTNEEIKQIKNKVDRVYKNAIKLESETLKYNCHSYAWYSTDVNKNEYWINEPHAYWEDGGMCFYYAEVNNMATTPSQLRMGDRAVYYDEDGKVDHSAIVYNSSGMLESKWGFAGLFRHQQNYCPYAKYDKEIKYYYMKPGINPPPLHN